MKVYVATRGDAIGMEKARYVYGLLEARGHTITHKWPDDIDNARAKGWMSDAEVPRDVRREHALRDLDGVTDARAFIYLSPHEKSEGAAAEMMGAIMHERFRGTPVTICVGNPACLFAMLCTHHVETIEEAIDIIDALAGNPLLPGQG